MARISSQWLKEHGVKGDEKTLQDVTAHAESVVAKRVYDTLWAQLSDEQRKVLKRKLGANASKDGGIEWLRQHVPDYDEVIYRVAVEFRYEIMHSDHPITYILEQNL